MLEVQLHGRVVVSNYLANGHGDLGSFNEENDGFEGSLGLHHGLAPKFLGHLWGLGLLLFSSASTHVQHILELTTN